jgi:hypothetical protein
VKRLVCAATLLCIALGTVSAIKYDKAYIDYGGGRSEWHFYFLTDDKKEFEEILSVALQEPPDEIVFDWSVNTGLSPNVKTMMGKNKCRYSVTMYKDGNEFVVIANWKRGDEYYFDYWFYDFDEG